MTRWLRRLVVPAALLSITVSPASPAAETIEAAKQQAYRQFAAGQAFAAARKLKDLASATADRTQKANLLRDVMEICATAYDWDCAALAGVETFEHARSDPKLAHLLPELHAYMIRTAVWRDDKAQVERFVREGGVDRVVTPLTNPAVAAELHLAMQGYYLRNGDFRAAERAHAGAVLSLLLIDPQKTFTIVKVLVDMLEGMVAAQDFAGAGELIAEIEPYITVHATEGGLLSAKYASVVAELRALTQSPDAIALLETARERNSRVELDPYIKSYRLGIANNLHALTLILQDKPAEARDVHAAHPLQARRAAIIAAGRFGNVQEFYFSLLDILVPLLNGATPDPRWRALMGTELAWENDYEARAAFKAYRGFALGLLALAAKEPRAEALLKSAARERIALFDQALRRKFEAFAQPSAIDVVLMMVGASIASKPEDDDLVFAASEILLRTPRHQLSDFAVLLGAQADIQRRREIHSFNLLVRQKREWELRTIGQFLGARASKTGAQPTAMPTAGTLIATYTDLVDKVERVKDRQGAAGADAMGLPRIRTVQDVLGEREALVAYFRHMDGLGRMCITRSGVTRHAAPGDPRRLRADIRLLELALSGGHAPDAALDSQYPVDSAMRVHEVLFGGLASCMAAADHVIVALPEDVSGIPLGALLSRAPPLSPAGYDLRRADWLAKRHAFSVTVSARHYLGTRKTAKAEGPVRPYLGIGDPVPAAAPAAGPGLSALERIPDTADEIRSVAAMMEAAGSDLLLASAATEQAFRMRPLGDYDVLHFATHGLLRDDVPGLAQSALVLTRGDGANAFDDGMLSASEVSRLSLRARLVVLSACNTARIDTRTASRGVADLQSAFSVAGSPSLLAALWSVETVTARDLMTRFFTEWKDGRSVSQAMADAMRGYLAAADTAHQHPRFWAPFVVFGYGGTDSPSRAEPPALTFAPLPGASPGETMDMRPLDGGVVISSLGDWNGHRFASLISRFDGAGPARWTVRSHEIGAGRLAASNDFVIAAGYTAEPLPVLRRIGKTGAVAWSRRFADWRGYTFADVLLDGREILALAHPTESKGAELTFHLARVDLNGETRQTSSVLVANVLNTAGPRVFLTRTHTGMLLVANAQEPVHLDHGRRGLFGMAPACLGRLTTHLFEVKRDTLEIVPAATIADFQANTAEATADGVILGGHARGACDGRATAAIVELRGRGPSRPVWRDESPFASTIVSLQRRASGLHVVLRQARPLGVPGRTVIGPSDHLKRWADIDNEVSEIALLQIRDGVVTARHGSTFGLSAFVNGRSMVGGRDMLFGSLGGYPATSVLGP